MPHVHEVSADQDECGLPPQLLTVIDRQWPHWRVLHIPDLDSEDQNLWTYARGRVCPGVSLGHFLDTVASDYAIAVFRGHQQAIIVAHLDQSRWHLSTVMPPINVRRFRVIWLAKPGIYTDRVTERKIQAKTDAIGFEELGGDVTVFVRQRNRFVPVRISS